MVCFVMCFCFVVDLLFTFGCVCLIYGLLFVNSVVLAVIFRYVMSLLVCWLLYSLWFVVLVFVVCFCGGFAWLVAVI